MLESSQLYEHLLRQSNPQALFISIDAQQSLSTLIQVFVRFDIFISDFTILPILEESRLARLNQRNLHFG
jgi:hypothetical protein